MSAQVTDIKNAIKTKLDALKTAGTLGTVIMDDFKKDPLERDIGVYPAAILTTASIDGVYETNRDNMRTHTFDVVIVQKGENNNTTTTIEELMEAVLNGFDNLPTLNGTAVAGLEAAAVNPVVIPTTDGSFIVFHVILKAKSIFSLT